LQSAGFFYQILPYLEETELYRLTDIVGDNPPGPLTTAFNDAPAGSYMVQLETSAPWSNGNQPGTLGRTKAIKAYHCPSRRAAALYEGWRNVKTDYAAVSPPRIPLPQGATPESEFWGDNGRYFGVLAPGLTSSDTGNNKWRRLEKVTFASVKDGTSNVMMLGEKFMNPDFYVPGPWGNFDDKGAFHGFDNDHFRSTVNAPNYPLNPSQDEKFYINGDPWNSGFTFGSAHPAGMNAVFADGHVVSIKYGVDATLFNLVGHRQDGGPIDLEALK
jgi:prepilin-type processing-associated H-X9-DG protein